MKPIRIFSLFFSLLSTLFFSGQEWTGSGVQCLSWRFEDVFFVNELQGWAVDGGGQVLHTDDGGVSWSQQLYLSDHYFRSVEFLDMDVGFAATLGGADSDAQLYRTVNGGEDWEELTTLLPATVEGICGMQAIGDSTIFLTGTFWTTAFIMRSYDLGLTWDYMDMGEWANGLVDIAFIDEMNGLAVGQSAQGSGLRAVILGTSDGGDNWEVRATGTANNQRSWKIQYLNPDVVYASIEEFEPSPQYFKSTDGGENWTLMDVSTTQTGGTMQGIGFLNEQHGWIGGWSDLLYETTDGGLTWEYQPGEVNSMNRFVRIDDQTMIAGGVDIYTFTAPGTTHLFESGKHTPQGHAITCTMDQVSVRLVGHTYLELSIYDAHGRKLSVLDQGRRDAGEYHYALDRPNLAPGVYFIGLYTYHGYDALRFVVQ